MFTINGDVRCRDAALIVGDSLINKQSNDGTWFKLDEAEAMDMARHDCLRIEGTAEFVVWLMEIVCCLRESEEA